MSILANLLNKSEQPQESGQIPPGLLKSVASGGEGGVRRRIYLLVGAGVAAAVVSGVFLVLYMQSRPTVQAQIARQPAPVAQTPVQAVQLQVPYSAASAVAPVPQSVDKPQAIAAKQAVPMLKKKAVARRAASGVKHAAICPIVPQPAPSPEHKANIKDRSTIDAYLFAARSAEARRDYHQALNLYRQALRADPDNYRIMNNIASSLLRMGQHDEALVFVNRALAQKRDYVSALVNGGIAYGKKGDDETARSMFSRAVNLEPTNKAALYSLSLSQERSGKPEEALTLFRRLADCGDVQGQLGMARIYEKNGDKGEALRLYREITGLSGSEDAAKEIARKRISSLE